MCMQLAGFKFNNVATINPYFLIATQPTVCMVPLLV